MTETMDDFNIKIRKTYDALKQEAITIAETPEIVDGLLQQIYDDDEMARYDAAQILTLLPETAPQCSVVREALVTLFLREESSSIQSLLAQKLMGLAAGPIPDYLAFGALKAKAESDASVVVRRWCYSGMSSVHLDFIAEATRFLKAQRASQPDYRPDIDESLAALNRRRCPDVWTRLRSSMNMLIPVLGSLTVALAVVLLILFQAEKRTNGLAMQIGALQQQIRTAATSPLHPAEKNDKEWAKLLETVAKGQLVIDSHILQWSRVSPPLGPNEHIQQGAIQLLSPVNTFVLSHRPEFRWKQKGARAYYRLRIQTYYQGMPVARMLLYQTAAGAWEARVYGANSAQLLGICPISTTKENSETVWVLPMSDKIALEEGETYRWFVEELKGPSIDAEASGKYDRIGIFQISNPALSEAELNRARSAYADSHILLGAFYAKYGFIDAAQKELLREQDARQAAAILLKILDNPQ